MVDIRKIVIIFVVAILFSVLVFATIEAVYPSPQYEEYCKSVMYPEPVKASPENTPGACKAINVPENETQSCNDKKGYMQYKYDSTGCATTYYCETCQRDYDAAMQEHQRYVFYISAFFALIAIFIGMFLPAKTNQLNEWIGTGFMLGGAFALFFGTATAYSSLDRIVRPVVIFLELVLVIFMAYRKVGNLRKDGRKR